MEFSLQLFPLFERNGYKQFINDEFIFIRYLAYTNLGLGQAI